jgi:hypothetical protein
MGRDMSIEFARMVGNASSDGPFGGAVRILKDSRVPGMEQRRLAMGEDDRRYAEPTIGSVGLNPFPSSFTSTLECVSWSASVA